MWRATDTTGRNHGEDFVINHLTLDGVMQAPAPPDEDPRDGFPFGGWATERSNDEAGAAMGAWFGPHRRPPHHLRTLTAARAGVDWCAPGGR